MKQYSYDDIKRMAENKDNVRLALHWEGQNKAKMTKAWSILLDIEHGKYTAEQFDNIGYCVSWLDYELEQRGII